MALSFGAEALVSIDRVEEFLLLDEKREEVSGLERRNSVKFIDKKRNKFDDRF